LTEGEKDEEEGLRSTEGWGSRRRRRRRRRRRWRRTR
jgi:hypothetical protein